MPISEINGVLGIELPATGFHTVGGFVEARLRHLAAAGESVSEAGWRFTVEEATDRAIVRLRVERI